MKAMVLNKPAPVESKPLEPEYFDIEDCCDDEILIEVSACGVCRTDLHTVEGEIIPPHYPIIPGHEVVGKIIEKGNNVDIWSIGDRVGIPWLYSSCGECEFCMENMSNLCVNSQFTGFHVNGGYSDLMKLNANSCYLLPENYNDVQIAPLLCGGVVGYRAYKLTGLKRNQILGLYGFGASAHIVLQVALYQGNEVYVFTRGEKHKSEALKLGANWVGSPIEKPPRKHNSSIVFTPSGESLPLALDNTKKGGRVVLGGIYMSDIPQMKYQLLYNEKEIKSTANSTREDVFEFLKFAEKNKIKTVVEVFPLENANEVLEMVKYSKISASAVLTPK